MSFLTGVRIACGVMAVILALLSASTVGAGNWFDTAGLAVIAAYFACLSAWLFDASAE